MTTASITVTERAAQRIAQIVCNEPDKKMFRISVEGGGCSGFEYRFDLVPKAEPQDAVIEHADAKILVDLLSLDYLAGSEIDYVDDLLSASFKIKNPNATAACGCGTSSQRSPPLFLTTAACGGLRSTPDCRPRRPSLISRTVAHRRVDRRCS